MAPIPALRFLTFVLFFFTNGQGISARDLKVDLQDEKQVESKDEPYITQYRTTQPNYAASYTTTKHNNHLSLPGKLSDPYTSGYNGYKTSPSAHKASQPNYIAGYRTHTHDSNEPYITANGGNGPKQPDYISGYRTHTHDSNEAYITSYGDNKPKHPNYIAGYRTHTHDSDEPYVTSYGDNEPKKPNHIAETHDSNEPYITSYGDNEPKKPNYIAGYKTRIHDSGEPYITSYGDNEPKKPNYIVGYKTHIHDSGEPYITSYGDNEPKKPNYIAGYRTHTHDSGEPYITSYGDNEPKQPNYIAGYGTHTHDSGEPYITSYGDNEPKQPNYIAGYRTRMHGSTEPYITSYGDNEPKKPNYIAGYKTHTHDSKELSSPKEDSKDSPSPDLDRTEAFKTGFFTLDDLYVGNAMTLQFPVQEVSPYLLRKEADSIPLSMSELPSVLQLFSIPEDSPEAKSMRRTLEQCEDEPITGETKTCANSLESMLEFVDKVIGSDTKHNILTTGYPSPSASPLQKYTISEVSHDIDAPKWVACHPLSYPYAIRYCHFIATGTKVFKVSLVGENNGDKMEALGICHLDTSDWSPDHVIFRQLGIKAGKDTPVCHFFPVKHLMWIPQPSKATM